MEEKREVLAKEEEGKEAVVDATEVQEYTTFTTTNRAGESIELAVVDEFEYDRKNYVAGALIQGDTVSTDGVYIYRLKAVKDDYVVEKITDPAEFALVSKAYSEME